MTTKYQPIYGAASLYHSWWVVTLELLKLRDLAISSLLCAYFLGNMHLHWQESLIVGNVSPISFMSSYFLFIHDIVVQEELYIGAQAPMIYLCIKIKWSSFDVHILLGPI